MDRVENHLSCSRKKEVIKKKAAGGKYQFRTAHSATQHLVPIPPVRSPESNTQPVVLESLYGYFDNLAAAETNKK